MTLYACVPVVNAENGKLNPLLPRGAAIPEDWPEEVRKSLEDSGCAVSLSAALDMITKAHEPLFESPRDVAQIQQQLVNDHGKDIAAKLHEKLSARWLAEIEVAIANDLAPPPKRETNDVAIEATVKVKKPRAAV